MAGLSGGFLVKPGDVWAQGWSPDRIHTLILGRPSGAIFEIYTPKNTPKKS